VETLTLKSEEGEEMSERDGYQPGVPCWVDTLQPDPDATVRFYGDLFGWNFKGPGPMPGDPPGQYFVAEVRGRNVAGVGSQPPGGAPSRPAWNTYISIESADDTAKNVKSAGGRIVVDPFDVLPAGRMAVLTDPARALFCVWEAKQRKGAQLVNAPWAWAMSQLNTDDPAGSEVFYGAVFGWVTDTFEMGGGGIKLWRLPGYEGGGLEQPVPRDVVAVMIPIRSDDSAVGLVPHWSVDFWVDDVDATASKAGMIGGKVIVPPFDTAVGRTAVLADPQGAVFSVSKVGPGV
jgi:predicted enzyme related to lactoylglutathione lyase